MINHHFISGAPINSVLDSHVYLLLFSLLHTVFPTDRNEHYLVHSGATLKLNLLSDSVLLDWTRFQSGCSQTHTHAHVSEKQHWEAEA